MSFVLFVVSDLHRGAAWMSLTALLALPTGAAGQPERGDVAVVVYNTRVPESKTVADHYAQQRGVPGRQVLGLALPPTEVMTRGEFRRDLQEPLFNWLVSQRLFVLSKLPAQPAASNVPVRVVESRVRYAVLCYGVPLKIQQDSTLLEDGASKLRAELRRNEAAVDSELTWLPRLLQPVMLAGLITNAFYGTAVGSSLQPTNGVLLVARLDGPSAEIARGLVDKALEAERDGLWGRAYIDTRGIKEGSLKIGDDLMHGAARVCAAKGYDVAVDLAPATLPATHPLSQVAVYTGWYAANACGPFAQPTVEFMPGAFAYHLHSFSAGTVRSTAAHWVGPLLAKGAAATLGSVYEPYLSGTSDVAVLLRNWLLLGFSFGEAAWSAEFGFSWQTTVVGDPLYRPWSLSVEERQHDLEQRGSPLTEWPAALLADRQLARGAPLPEVVAHLRQLPMTGRSAVLNEKLGDLLRLRNHLPDALAAYRAALDLRPSPQQRVRLLLTLADGQTAVGQYEPAIATLQELLRTCPGYADEAGIRQKLLSLAVKTGNAELKAEFEVQIQRLKRATTTPADPSPR